ncbi:hypothetical protein [Virgibacillus salexigens]|uniref:hypothetical protein n=1 Tax=Virgibacillus salexigens TaxID=61016 RepID=UPI00190B1F36|nr:hypothetical protein [Virgibacillus salexigens]
MVFLLLLLAACVSESKTFMFSGEAENWSADLKVTQSIDDYEIQDFVLKYKGSDVNSVGEITYSVDSGVGSFGRSGATLEENGTLTDSNEANPTNAKVSENAEVEVTLEWNDDTETFKLASNASSPTETYKESIKEGQQERSIIEEELTVNGKSDPAKYPSNSHLYMAHLLSASLSGNTEVDNGGKPIDIEEIESTLEGVSEELSQIKYEGERKSELQNVIDLTDQAINSDPQKGDEILNKIHTILHELDNHFNTNPFIDS